MTGPTQPGSPPSHQAHGMFQRLWRPRPRWSSHSKYTSDAAPPAQSVPIMVPPLNSLQPLMSIPPYMPLPQSLLSLTSPVSPSVPVPTPIRAGYTINNALLAFFIEAGCIPGTVKCDFDTKFIAGSSHQLLLKRGIRLQSPPGGRKSQNGLTESHWKHIVRMDRALLVDHGMPKRLWFFALGHAVQVCNYLPIMVDGYMTTSFKLVHQCQPNYQAVMCPIFSHGYFRSVRDGSRDRLQFEPQSQPVIAIGRSELTNGIMFWNPKNKKNRYLLTIDSILLATYHHRSTSSLMPPSNASH
jgi:hypothetical protein